MILVDSNVWIDSLRQKTTPEVQFLSGLQKDLSEEICLSHIIYFEVLRGIPNDLERKRAQKILEGFTFRDYVQDGFWELILLCRSCQRRGLNLPRLCDWLILKTVLDHSLKLLTSDRDFHRMHQIRPFALIRLH